MTGRTRVVIIISIQTVVWVVNYHKDMYFKNFDLVTKLPGDKRNKNEPVSTRLSKENGLI